MDLKEQLLKAGLVSQKQARQAAHRDRVVRKQDGGESAQREAETRAEEARRQKEADRVRDQEIARQQAAKQAERELALKEQAHRQSAIDAALREGRIENWNGNRTYYFVDGTRIESLQVSETAANLMQDGRAAIVRSGDPRAPYMLINSAGAVRLKEADAGRIVTFHGDASPAGRR